MSNQDVLEGVNIIEEELEAHETEKDGSTTVLLSTGVVLRHTEKPPSKIILAKIIERYEYPDPPMSDMGKGRLEPNPNHPDYTKAVEEIDAKRGFAFYDALIVLGTEIESIPVDMEGPDDTGWIDEMEILGFEVDKREKALYRDWVRNYAASSEEDMKLIIAFVVGRLGATEGQVQIELDKFPGN